MKTGYNPPTLAALAQNNDNTNDDIETRDRNQKKTLKNLHKMI